MNIQSNTNFTRATSRLFALLLALTVFIGSSLAFTTDEILYDPMNGPRVSYKNIYESSSTDIFDQEGGESIGHYGPPTLVGDAMQFNTPMFAAIAASSTRATDITDGFLSMDISAAPGEHIEKLHLFEFGSINLTSTGTGNHTMVNIDSPVFITVNEVLLDDGTPDGMLHTLSNSVTVSSHITLDPPPQSPAGWNLAENPDIRIWEGDVMIDIPTALAEELASSNITIPGDLPIRGFTRGSYKMDNILTAVAAENVSTAFIDKKGVYIDPFPAVLPEPSTLALVLPLLVAGLIRRRISES